MNNSKVNLPADKRVGGFIVKEIAKLLVISLLIVKALVEIILTPFTLIVVLCIVAICLLVFALTYIYNTLSISISYIIYCYSNYHKFAKVFSILYEDSKLSFESANRFAFLFDKISKDPKNKSLVKDENAKFLTHEIEAYRKGSKEFEERIRGLNDNC
jgi:hypothetical protein